MKIKNIFILGLLICTSSAVLASSATQPKSQILSESNVMAGDMAVLSTPLLQTILTPGDFIIAVDKDGGSRYPSAENPSDAIDGSVSTKYLNFGRENSGFIVTPSYGVSMVTGFRITTANDVEARDPSSYEIYGTNETIKSTDNSNGMAENWTLIASGSLSLPSERLTEGELELFDNSEFYTSYKVIFPTVKNPGTSITTGNAMQIAEFQFYSMDEVVSSPVIIKQPQSQTISEGSSVTFGVTAIGTKPLSYQWYKNGFMLQGATDRQYRIEKVSQSDAGQYFVIVSNDIDSVTSNLVSLTVYEGVQGITVTCYQSDMYIESIDDAEACIANPSQWIAEPIVEVYDVINFSDSGIGTHFENPVLFPCQSEVGKDNENFVMLIETQINIPEAGYWSFGVLSDDGFKLNITGNGVDFYSEYSGTRAAEDTVTSFNFPLAGIYQVRLLYFEATADAELEFYAAKGQYNSFNGNCRLVGDVANGGLPVGNLEDSAPVITKQPRNQIVTEGSSVTFSVTATGTNPLSYQWYKDGFMLQGANDRQYRIEKVSQSDAGQYFVIVSNDVGSVVSDMANLSIATAGEGFFVSYYYPSSFISSIGSAEACISDPSASAPEGYPASEWVNVINYSDFEEDTATSLPLEEHFLDSKMFPAHQYGYVRYKSHVLLAEGDVMISEPGIWSIGVCHDDGFSLSITGNDVDFHSEYDWITSAQDTIQSFDFPVEGVYHFRLLHYNNEGPAALELYAAKGSYSSFNSDFRLIGDVANGGLPVGIVEDSAPVITIQPQSQTIMEGNTVTFSVTATGTNPLSYQWYRDGFILQGGTNRQYTIDKVSQSDAGQYFVIVKNELGNIVSDLATLTVAVPPVIVKQPESLSVLEGEEALLSVEAEHAVTYQWYKDSNIINGATNAVYRIANTIQGDAGQYYVLVGNEYKNIQSDRMTLAVYKMPVITRQPVSVSVLGGESVTFSVEAENATDYQWYKNGKIIDGANRPLYIMDGITGYDVGEYSVTVSNKKASVASDTVTLEISEPYRATAEVVIYNGSVISFTVTDPGWGYEWTPKIRVKDENGSGAEAHCVMENGMVVGIEIDEPGSGYSENAYVKVGSPYKYNSLSIQVSEVLITMFVNLGEKYQLECTEDHITWKKVGEPFIAEDEEVQIRLEVVDHNYYFRVHEVKQ